MSLFWRLTGYLLVFLALRMISHYYVRSMGLLSWWNISKRASRTMKGLLSPRLRSGTLSCLQHSIDGRKHMVSPDSRSGEKRLPHNGKSCKVILQGVKINVEMKNCSHLCYLPKHR